MFGKQLSKMVSGALLAMAFGAVFMGQASAACRIDWNNDGVVSETDYLVGSPIGGFYAEWYIYQYYPVYYPILFPTGDTSRLDYNEDGVTDQDDLMGPLDAVQQSEGFYVEWYINMFYPAYYAIFMPESTCPPEGMANTNFAVMAGAPFYGQTSGVLFYSVSRDGSLVAGKSFPDERPFVFETTDYMADPTGNSYYEYLGTDETVVRLHGFSTDKNLVITDLRDVQIDGASMIWGAYYDRTAGAWTTLPKPLPEEDYSTHYMGSPRVKGISADGTKIAGYCAGFPLWGLYVGYVYDIATATYTILYGDGSGGDAIAEKVNEDGSIVVGRANGQPAIWTRQPDGNYSLAFATPTGVGRIRDVSTDGQYHVGMDYGSFHVYGPSGTTSVTTSSTYSPRHLGISDDGGVVVGTHSAGLGYVDPFIWREGYGYQLLQTYMTAAGAPVDVGFEPGRFAPFDLSSEGTVYVGFADNIGTQYGFLGVTDPGL